MGGGSTRLLSPNDPIQNDERPAERRQPVAEPGVETLPRIDGYFFADDAVHFLRRRPRGRRRADDFAVRVDECRDAHVDGPHDASPGLDRPESADGEMAFVLFGALEPAVVRDVHEEIDRSNVLGPSGVLPCQLWVSVFV